MRKKIITIFTIVFIIMLVINSRTSIEAAKMGLKTWTNNVFPCLFPFFVATEILTKTSFIVIFGKILEKPTKVLFNVTGESSFALIMGMICGYPTGAKIVSELKKNGVITKIEAERLIAFTNNSGPLFIIGTIGVSFLKNQRLGYILLISHLISCVLVGIIFRNWKKGEKSLKRSFSQQTINNNNLNFGEILGEAIKNSLITISNIGGFIVIFAVIISMFSFAPNAIR